MVLLKRQKIVYRGLPGPVASFQQQAAGEHLPDAADGGGAASSSSNGGGGSRKKGAADDDDADKKEEVVSAKKEVYYLAETGEIFLDYECVPWPLPSLGPRRSLVELAPSLRARPPARLPKVWSDRPH